MSCPAAALSSCCGCQSSKARVHQLSPSLQQQLRVHRGQKLRHLSCFWVVFCRRCLPFCCHYHIASLTWAVKCNTRVQRQQHSWDLLTCSQALEEMVLAWMEVFQCTLLKDWWPGFEWIMLGSLFDFQVVVTHMTRKHITVMYKTFPPRWELR